MRTPTFFLLLLVGAATAARLDTGYGRYGLIAGDVIFNAQGDQLRFESANDSNQSINLQFVPALGTPTRLTVYAGGNASYGTGCVVLNHYYGTANIPNADLSWFFGNCQEPTGPQFSYLRVQFVGRSFAGIYWETDALANTTLLYRTENGTTKEASIYENATTHSVNLRNLRPGTSYIYQARSCRAVVNGTCADSSLGTFTTLQGDEIDASSEKEVAYPLDRSFPPNLQGFRVGLANASDASALITLSYDGEDLCRQEPGICVIGKGVENDLLRKRTGLGITLLEGSDSTALLTFRLLATTRFPPAVILRPLTLSPEQGTKSQAEVRIYDPESLDISQATFRYENGGNETNQSLKPGTTMVSYLFATTGQHRITVTAINSAGLLANVSRVLSVKTPEPPTPTLAPPVKKKATTTPSPTPVSAIEKIRQQIAQQEKDKTSSLWDYLPMVGAILAGLAIAGGTYYFWNKKKEPKPK